jgi:cell wall-associated NlpC family hydrolase
MFGGSGGPGAYLNAVGMAEVLAGNRVDLIAASAADSTVAGVFARQAAGLLAQRRADLATAASLKKAVQSAVAAQLTAVAAAKAHRGQVKAQLASATRAEATLEAEASAATAAPVVTVAGGGSGQSWPAGGVATAAQGATAVNWALTQIGKPYQWGGAGPGSYDCSGLAMDAWARAGIQLAHWTGYQWLSGPHVPIGQLRPGDLVFFATNTADPATIHHVGIYVGQGMMVDAPYTGVDVRIDSIYAVGGLIGATRPAA